MHDLLNQGRGLKEIARHLVWGLQTVQRYARAATWQELADGCTKKLLFRGVAAFSWLA